MSHSEEQLWLLQEVLLPDHARLHPADPLKSLTWQDDRYQNFVQLTNYTAVHVTFVYKCWLAYNWAAPA